MPFSHDDATRRWTGPELPTNADDPIFSALIGAVLDRLLLLEPVSESGDPTATEISELANAFVSNWWEMLAGGDLDGTVWLERIGSVLRQGMSRDPNLIVLETAVAILRGRESMTVWDFAAEELETVLTYPVVANWEAARYPGTQAAGHWEGQVYNRPADVAEFRLLRPELPVFAELDAALDRDVEQAATALEFRDDWTAMRAHAKATGQELRRLAALGAEADFPDASAPVDAVVTFARTLR